MWWSWWAFTFLHIHPLSGLSRGEHGVSARWSGVIMPVIAIILIVLAIRKIGADEALVRSLNRLRR